MKQTLSRAVAGLLVMAAAILLAACGKPDTGAHKEADVTLIEGSVSYRERLRLPPDALVEVELQDISRADAPASILATVIGPASSAPPYAYRIEYDSANIAQRHRYSLRAVITRGGKLLFSSTEYIDPFAGNPVDITVSQIPEPVAGAGGNRAEGRAPDTTLEDVQWLLLTLDGEPVTEAANGKRLDLMLDSGQQLAGGFSGCNRYRGSYRREGVSQHGTPLGFGALAGTLRACPEGTGLERRYLDALAVVDSFRLQSDGTLALLSGANVVLTFEPAD
ncbi:MAG: YbaY family lipoprotein [Parahaliea sp.]